MSFPRYERYKDSGVEWLGKVPEHWDELPLKAVASYNDEVLDDRTADDYELLYVDISSVDATTGISSKEALIYSSAPSRARRRVKHGDVIVSTVRTYLRAIARIHEPEENLIVSTGFCVVRPRQRLFHGFLGYLVSSNYFVDAVISHSVGVSYPAINASDLVSIKITLPPIPEQQTIAAFLDRETAKIDALIAEQQRLIDLLKEKRQAVISHAVTKGLNPNAPMKDSGVEWLGEVPEHWGVKKLRHIAKIVRGASPRPAGDPKFFSPENFDGNCTPWVTVAEITKDLSPYLTEVSEYLTPLGVTQSQFFESGTLIFTNSGATLGVPKILAINCCANDGVLVFKDLSHEIKILFAYYFLMTTTERLRTEMKQGGGQPNLNTDLVKNIGFAVPPISEQSTIVNFLDNENAKLDALTAEAQTAITLLQERRTALISAAVTGKIDVRGFASDSTD